MRAVCFLFLSKIFRRKTQVRQKNKIRETAVIACVISDCRSPAVFDRLLVTARVWDIITFCKKEFAALSCVREGFSVLFNQSASFYFYNANIGYHDLLDAENQGRSIQYNTLIGKTLQKYDGSSVQYSSYLYCLI